MSDPVGWRIVEVHRDPVYLLISDDFGPVKTCDGGMHEFSTWGEAARTAENWDATRMPSWEELQSMPDDELRRLIREQA